MGFEINTNYVIVYSKTEIYYQEILDIFKKEELNSKEYNRSMKLEKINLLIDTRQVYIHKIETGSSPYKIAISLKNRHSSEEVFFMTWDLFKNEEISSLEISDRALTMFDSQGEIYLIEDGKVYLTEKKVCLTCF